jgi:hypothetical protein
VLAGIELGNGDAVQQIRSFWPEMRQGNGKINLSLKLRMTPRGPEFIKGPFSFTADTQRVLLAATARQMAVRIEATAPGRLLGVGPAARRDHRRGWPLMWVKPQKPGVQSPADVQRGLPRPGQTTTLSAACAALSSRRSQCCSQVRGGRPTGRGGQSQRPHHGDERSGRHCPGVQ